ncbi:MAG: NADP-dependent phosphogluconate dehydrogenase [Armatimonadetes bacterium]|nr:NADP-dependent phosphogluconate dehydrogenase [Armatimonadota bacterium]
MNGCEIGVVGLAVMGENLALNIERNGFPVAVYNRTAEKTKSLMAGRAAGKRIEAAYSIPEFSALLKRPRRVILMVQAGPAVDAVLRDLSGHLEAGDIVIDGGNSHFRDTERRLAAMEAKGFSYLGMGVSGGEEGALYGPSLMPGGHVSAYRQVEPILTKIAAQVDDGPCCAYIGEKGAGHFVKMAHNGIEYGDMQLIAETYDLMRSVAGLTPEEMQAIFTRWNGEELNSFLIEITARIVAFPDAFSGRPLVEMILDKAGQKGTGKWTSQAALDLGVAVPTISAAVDARILSAFKAERVEAAQVLAGPVPTPMTEPGEWAEALKAALYASKICSYAQGMTLLSHASREMGYSLKLDEIARLWKGGCIIRAAFLDKIKAAFRADPGLPNLLLDEGFQADMAARQAAWRRVVRLATETGVAVPAMSASLAYYDAYRRERVPANLLQAQRDYFGAHTYERTDREGVFHTDWNRGEG